MKNLDFAVNALDSVFDYVRTLNEIDYKSFKPSKGGLTDQGKRLTLGFSTYGLKIYYMLGEWDKLDKTNQNDWTNFINSFQKSYKNFPDNSFIDDVLYQHFNTPSLKSKSKDFGRNIFNLLPKYNFDTNKIKFQKAINAETKQAIASLYQVGRTNNKPYVPTFSTPVSLNQYLHSLNWSKPWTSGAQFASLCVYSKINKGTNNKLLINFVDSIADKETGSYFKIKPSHSREVINGAMKILSGLDWLDYEIHYPEKLIDYCIANKPITEGCDIVDYIYVLYRCTKQTNYKKEEILIILDESLEEIKKLYHKDSLGFSYFHNKSQTHYYGVEISNGKNLADLHGTLLCTWALIMILECYGNLKTNYKIIKP
jgi:hypothetical protein